MNDKGQLSIIAALLVAVILITTVAATYSLIRDNPIQGQPQIQSALDETDLALKQILASAVSYYGSILRVTGNSTYAKTNATNYLQSGLNQIANTHPEWASSVTMNSVNLYANWYASTSYSGGDLTVTYNLTGLGITGMSYSTSCRLGVSITDPVNNQACLNVTEDVTQPLVNLGKQSFGFFLYQNSNWQLAAPSINPTAYANGTYQIVPPTGIDVNSFLVQVQDQRGIIVVASSYSQYNMNLTWSPINVTPQSYYVNNNVSDIDLNGGLGTHSNFTAEQYGPDSNFDTLAEANGTFYFWQEDTSNYNSVTGQEGNEFWSNWTTNSTTSGTLTTLGIYVFATPGNPSPQVKLGIYDSSAGAPNNLLGQTNATTIPSNYSGWLDIDIVGGGVTISPNTTYYVASITNITPSTQWRYRKQASPVSFYKSITWPNLASPAGSTSQSVAYRYGAYRVGFHGYSLDLEAQWTGLSLAQNASLCIYGGNVSTESLLVDAWTGSTWQTVFANVTNGWNNASVSSYVSPPNFTIRFRDGNGGDAVKNSWQIDAALLRFDVNYSLSRVTDTITIELLQNGTARWLGQNLQLATPFPPIPTKAIHVNQTMNGANSEVPFQIEDWASSYRVALGLTSNASIFNYGNMLVFLANSNVSRVTVWWNGSDMATQTPFAYTNRYFTDNPSTGVLSNGKMTLQIPISTGYNTFIPTSTVGNSSCTADFMRINNNNATYGSAPAFVITNGPVRDIVHQEAEWTNGIQNPNCSNVYSDIELTLPANATYYTYQLTLIFINSAQNRNITDLCPIWLSNASASQIQTENGITDSLPIVQNGPGLFYNSSSVWQHHWSQFSSGTAGAGIIFTNSSNQGLYTFDSIAGTNTGALAVSSASSTIQLLPVNMSQVSFNNAMNVAWNGAVVTFSGNTPIYNNSDQTGLWMLVEYPPIINVSAGN